MASPAGPVRVSLQAPDLVRAGLASMLEPHADRVMLLPAPDSPDAEVEIFDPLRHGRASFLSPHADVPLVGLVYDGDRVTTALAYELGAERILTLSAGAAEVLTTLESLRGLSRSAIGTQSDLTPREIEVVTRICSGLSNVEISQELFLSINSVKTYIRGAYRKMGVTSRTQAVLWGIERGLVGR
jgi:DNA-binding NarL/FixJ family response regulator